MIAYVVEIHIDDSGCSRGRGESVYASQSDTEHDCVYGVQ
jgi:hypothetical protein